MTLKVQDNAMIAKEKKIDQNIIIVIVAIAILSFMGILSETGLNIAYSLLMNKFNVSASVIHG